MGLYKIISDRQLRSPCLHGLVYWKLPLPMVLGILGLAWQNGSLPNLILQTLQKQLLIISQK